jgi:thymidine phosphorylase
VNVRTAITDMDQPLGSAVGNALEVEEARQVLLGVETAPNSRRFRALCVELAGLTLWASGLAKDLEEGQAIADRCLSSGSAAEKARAWYQAQGGDFDGFRVEPRPTWLLASPASGRILRVDARLVGETVVALGGGRRTKEDVLDLHVGIRIPKGVGSEVREGETLAEVHARTEAEAAEAVERLRSAFLVGEGREAANRSPVLEVR